MKQIIAGGMIDYATYAEATHNTVTLKGDVKVVKLYGGRVGINSFALEQPPVWFDDFTGNLLNVIATGTTGIEVTKTVSGFERYRFLFDADAPGAAVGLLAKGTIYLNDWREDEYYGRSAVIESVDFLAGQVPKVGTQVVLMQADAIDDTNFTQTEAYGMSGINLEVNYGLSVGLGNPSWKLIATVNGVRAHPQMESPSQGRNAGLAFVTTGLGPVVKGINGRPAGPDPGACPGMFFEAEAGSMRYGYTAGYDLNSYMGALGLNCGGEVGPGNLALGGYVDFAYGEYESSAALGGRRVEGRGDLERIGGGLMARYDLDPKTVRDMGLEASLRFGQLRQNYTSEDFINAENDARFNTESLYVGGHVGVSGKAWSSETSRIDVYGRYSHVWLQGDRATVDGSAPVNFEDSSSMAARAGARLTKDFTPRLRLKLGLAYEQEFGGETKATTNGYRIPTVSSAGGTGVAELGLAYGGDEPRRLSVGLGLEGHAGRRQGLAGNLSLSLAF
ncbi:MAG: autotransporter outer membrane beta-barrel domain-containing protein [Deltaproteobacteria bacterium]|nr:autotransporter outer membrane beta-barrel domain-containing protein [Deltaproteobacteria bacterium]